MIQSQETEESVYNYGRFRASEYALEEFPGPKVGEPAIPFTATTLDGRQVSLADFRGRIVVLETGSFTCPQYVRRINPMNELARAYPDIAFLLLYVREAHPGRHIAEHRTMEDKLCLAERLVQEENEARLVLVDDLAGTVHQAYGSLPNLIYIIGPDGRVLFRADWNNHNTTAKVVGRLARGESVGALRAGFLPVAPPLLFRVLLRAGWDALADFLVALPALIWSHLKAARSGAVR